MVILEYIDDYHQKHCQSHHKIETGTINKSDKSAFGGVPGLFFVGGIVQEFADENAQKHAY